MDKLWLGGCFAGGLLGIVWGIHRWRLAGIARDRLFDVPREGDQPQPYVRTGLVVRRRRWLAVVVALVGLIALRGFTVWSWPLVGSLSVVLMLLTGQMEAQWREFLNARLEQQLADVIDLLVSALRSGASLMSAMEHAVIDTRPPLKRPLEELLGRIRFGDRPLDAFTQLYERIPSEAFRLFTTTLAVHWEVGGSLSATLASVGRIIRDRIELQRRIRALSTHARISTLSVLGVTLFIGLVSWRVTPDRVELFLSTTLGQSAIAVCLVLQCVGWLWISALSKVRF